MSHNPITVRTILRTMDSRGKPGIPPLVSDSVSGSDSDSVSVVSSSGSGCSVVGSPKLYARAWYVIYLHTID